jgi:hypothetical protein
MSCCTGSSQRTSDQTGWAESLPNKTTPRRVRDNLAAFLTATTQDTWLIAGAHKFVVEITAACARASGRYILSTVPGEHRDRILQLFR